jgi:hypothetical protein
MNTKLLTALIFVSLSLAGATPANDVRKQAVRIVEQIQRADYEGDRAAMQRGYNELKPFIEDQKFASRIRYWRGFALWRRAINGFNDAIDPKELARDLNAALDEFKTAIELDPKFVMPRLESFPAWAFSCLRIDKTKRARKSGSRKSSQPRKKPAQWHQTIRGSSGCTASFFGILLPTAAVGRIRRYKITSAAWTSVRKSKPATTRLNRHGANRN